MIRIALRETKINLFFFIFASLGLSVLFALIFVLLNFRLQVTDSYFDKYKDNYLSLESNTTELLDYQIDNLFVFSRAEGLTYDTVISYQNKEINIPSYFGGICILSANDSINFFPNISNGEDFLQNTRFIWLSETLATELGCDIGSEIKLDNDIYYVKGLFDYNETPLFYESKASFFVYGESEKIKSTDIITAVISDPVQLMELAKIDGGKIFKDSDGVLELCRGFNALCVGIVFIICFLIVLLIVFFVSIIKIYLAKREEFIRILFRNGISNLKLVFTNALLFTIISVFACSLSILWGLIFNLIIISWASNIINITIYSPNYFLQWLLGMVCSLVVICTSLPLMLKKRLYKYEVSNQ